jgi:cytidine deaminase
VVNEDAFKGDCAYLEKKWNLEVNKFTPRAHLMLSQWKINERRLPILQSALLTQNVVDDLILTAQIARTHTYSPYSHFPVGAAILSKSGKIFTGCNVENAAYGSTICAERAAFVKVMSEMNEGSQLVQNRDFIACAIVLRFGGSPCGACRQMLNEVNPDMAIYMADVDGTFTQKSLRELLPDAFGPNSLT